MVQQWYLYTKLIQLLLLLLLSLFCNIYNYSTYGYVTINHTNTTSKRINNININKNTNSTISNSSNSDQLPVCTKDQLTMGKTIVDNFISCFVGPVSLMKGLLNNNLLSPTPTTTNATTVNTTYHPNFNLILTSKQILLLRMLEGLLRDVLKNPVQRLNQNNTIVDTFNNFKECSYNYSYSLSNRQNQNHNHNQNQQDPYTISDINSSKESSIENSTLLLSSSIKCLQILTEPIQKLDYYIINNQINQELYFHPKNSWIIDNITFTYNGTNLTTIINSIISYQIYTNYYNFCPRCIQQTIKDMLSISYYCTTPTFIKFNNLLNEINDICKAYNEIDCIVSTVYANQCVQQLQIYNISKTNTNTNTSMTNTNSLLDNNNNNNNYCTFITNGCNGIGPPVRSVHSQWHVCQKKQQQQIDMIQPPKKDVGDDDYYYHANRTISPIVSFYRDYLFTCPYYYYNYTNMTIIKATTTKTTTTTTNGSITSIVGMSLLLLSLFFFFCIQKNPRRKSYFISSIIGILVPKRKSIFNIQYQKLNNNNNNNTINADENDYEHEDGIAMKESIQTTCT